MKILHMTPPDINNGVYKYIFNHMAYMDQSKYQFSFWTKGKAELMETDEYKKYGFDIFEIKNVERGDKEAFRKDIEDVLSKGFDAVHLHTSSWRGFFIEQVAMEMGIKRVIVHSHSTGIDVIDELERAERIRIHEDFKEKFSFEYATDICACSGLAAEWLYGANVSKEDVVILPNAIETDKYIFYPLIRSEMRNRLGLENKTVIGNVGRYSYQKNQEFLIRCFAKAFEKNTSLYLLCLGQGDELENIKELSVSLGIEHAVMLLDWKNNIWDYLQMMDAFFLPSRFEGLPISLIEAQAAGLNCIVSDTVTRESAITDLVKYIPLTEEAWIKEMVDVEVKPRKNMYEIISSAGYDIKTAAEGLMRFYDRVI